MLQIPTGSGMLKKCQCGVTNEVRASQSMPYSVGTKICQEMSKKSKYMMQPQDGLLILKCKNSKNLRGPFEGKFCRNLICQSQKP